MPSKYKNESEMLKALAHPVRLRIIEILTGLSESKCSVNSIKKELGLPQSTVSQHLQVLRNKGIIDREKKCVKVCYRVSDERVLKILEILKKKK
ncbi:winged helix-turn-helix transcriptional regulator [bacterium]|nr:winged helix-turn-helix transcriptional regulator [bacterium]